MKRFRIVHHADRETIAEMYEHGAPVFILSTGRAGSKFVAELLDLAPELRAFHEPRPTLEHFSDFAHRNQARPEILRRMIDVARMETILETSIQGRIYVESNQCLTFFAPSLAELFRSSKFVHLVRHPGDFVVSAARKGWHRNDTIWEEGRVKNPDPSRWAGMDQIERLGWLWDFTNRYIRDFLASLPAARSMTCRLEELASDSGRIEALFAFCGGTEPRRGDAKRLQKSRVNALRIDPDEPPNMKKDPDFPAYEDWSEKDKAKLRRLAGEMSGLYGYEL